MDVFGYQMTALVSETIFMWFKVAWEIRLESYGPRHPLVVLWYNIVCVNCNPIYTSVFGAQLHLTTKLTYRMTPYYTPNDGSTAKDAWFY